MGSRARRLLAGKNLHLRHAVFQPPLIQGLRTFSASSSSKAATSVADPLQRHVQFARTSWVYRALPCTFNSAIQRDPGGQSYPACTMAELAREAPMATSSARVDQRNLHLPSGKLPCNGRTGHPCANYRHVVFAHPEIPLTFKKAATNRPPAGSSIRYGFSFSLPVTVFYYNGPSAGCQYAFSAKAAFPFSGGCVILNAT